MRAPARVSSKFKLAEALGISAPTLYQYLRLPDSPPPKNGYWVVADFRKFITKRRGAMETSEKQQLQLELLKAKVEKERNGVDVVRATEREKATTECAKLVEGSHQVVRSEFYRMRCELCPRFEGLTARKMFALWTERETQMYRAICGELRERGLAIEEENTRPSNVVEFNGNGNGHAERKVFHNA